MVLVVGLGCFYFGYSVGKGEDEKYYKELTPIMTVEIDPEFPNYRIYHLRITLEELRSYVEATDIYLASVFEAVEGVTGVHGSKYKITVYKSYLWNWEEIQPKFLKAIKELGIFIDNITPEESEKSEPETEDGIIII